MRFIHPQPTPEEITAMYNQDYFTSDSKETRPHGKSDYFNSVESESEIKTYKARLASIENYVKIGKLLEIGCGPGHFLNLASQRGWQTLGIEISEYAAEFARNQFNLNVKTGALDLVDLGNETFDVIFLGDLLEHVTNPKKLLIQLSHYLNSEGIVYIEIPSVTNGLYSRFGSLAMELINKVKYINLPPYHLFEFTPTNCRYLLKESGYEIVVLKQDNVKPGDLGLREGALLNCAKKGIQYINQITTYVTGNFGDRITLIAKCK